MSLTIGLILFTYGEENNREENVRLQKKQGVDAVITDNLNTASQAV